MTRACSKLWTVPAALLAGLSCSNDAPSRPQWEVFLATDAPVPQFGDEVLVDVLDGSASPAVRFLDASTQATWPVSFGIVPSDPSATVRLRVRFFRLSTTGANGLPSSAAILDTTAVLPPPDGLTTVAVVLAMRCFGVAPDIAHKRSCDPDSGRLAPEPILSAGATVSSLPAPGSWPPAASVGCRQPIPAGMSCVPGGAFLLGSPTFPRGLESVFDASAQDPLPEHVVQLSPYALDTFEVTVKTLRNLLKAHRSLHAPALHDPDENAPNGLCTYLGTDDSSNDDLPANCISWSSASSACALLGKRLPTEAEWEFAARNRTEESSYPWGTDPDACSHAVVARGISIFGDPTNCELPSNGFAPGPVAGGSPGDRTKLGIANLGGNLTEWVEDQFNGYAAPCWNHGTLLVDPVCTAELKGSDADLRSARGGSWFEVPSSSLGYMRNAWAVSDPSVGFRCALSR